MIQYAILKTNYFVVLAFFEVTQNNVLGITVAWKWRDDVL